MKKFFATLCAAAVFTAVFMSGCGSEKSEIPASKFAPKIDLSRAKDGVYIVESSRDTEFGSGTLTMTIRGKKIVAAEFAGFDIFGKVKDENYGSLIGNDDDYRKAQVAVGAIKIYSAQLVETQDLSAVDAISGATISYGQFVETVKRAVEEAAE